MTDTLCRKLRLVHMSGDILYPASRGRRTGLYAIDERAIRS
jgi:hypothetical protein